MRGPETGKYLAIEGALAICEGLRPDLVLLNIMPCTDGFQSCAELRKIYS